MTRKDTILIAVLINAGLLAILFATAIIYDTEKVLDPLEEAASTLVESNPPIEAQPVLIASNNIGDEVDRVLTSYATTSQTPIVIDTDPEVSEAISTNYEEKGKADSQPVLSSQESYVEITVKKGDVLEKIAKANGTTVGAIKRANNLQSERLNVGQVLRIPVKKEQAVYPLVKTPEKKENEIANAQYYIVKSGDNPWKIAKQFNIKFEDILRLNNLDEEKARNLKVGDKIRVK
jgi:peptidoglycan DL-endopeptidase LytF